MSAPYEALAERAARLRAETEAELADQLDALRTAAERPRRRPTLADITAELAEARWLSASSRTR